MQFTNYGRKITIFITVIDFIWKDDCRWIKDKSRYTFLISSTVFDEIIPMWHT